MKRDWLLFWWLLVDLLFGVFLMGGCAYLVFWRNQSGWWFLLAMMGASSPTLYKALARRFEVGDDHNEPEE